MHADAPFWNALADRYAAKPVEDPSAFERKIAVTRRHLRPDSHVVDLGCGTGSLALLLAPHCAEVHGVDFSEEMLRHARTKAAAQGASNVHFHVGTASTFERDPASLDVVMAWSLLHLVRDRPALLARMFELVKPGGVFVTSTVVLGGQWMPYWALLPVMRWMGKAPWVGIVRPDTLEAEIRAAGFVDLETPDVGAGSTTHFVVARRPERA